jgi:hypothetical protein
VVEALPQIVYARNRENMDLNFFNDLQQSLEQETNRKDVRKERKARRNV